ncbi:MAG: hypothetical protein OEZ01_06000 [Candidatus Heimdallarchaeota archaeon]|nr:hypothetical protein [Candidatus Heimdallarchaeota archaeon]MDH5645539.1 hypothetical protein [Candidatus Heimdallarchaeota archaeon]
MNQIISKPINLQYFDSEVATKLVIFGLETTAINLGLEVKMIHKIDSCLCYFEVDPDLKYNINHNLAINESNRERLQRGVNMVKLFLSNKERIIKVL